MAVYNWRKKINWSHLLWIPANVRFFYLVANSFAHEEGGDMEWQHILKKQLVDILHGLHLLSLCLKTTVQQEVHTTTQLILRERKIANMKEQIYCEFFCLQIRWCAQNTLYLLDMTKRLHNQCLTHIYLSGKYEAYNVEDDQPNSWHDLRVL